MQHKSFILIWFYVDVYSVIKRNIILFFTKINFGYRVFLAGGGGGMWSSRVLKSNSVRVEFGGDNRSVGT
jgi:hypothetical protein